MKRAAFFLKGLSIMIMAGASAWAQFGPEEAAARQMPVHEISENAPVREWVTLGPFPNPDPEAPVPGADYRQGFHPDYLKALGGEANAILEPATVVAFEKDGERREVVAALTQVNELNNLDFKETYGMLYKVAYAFAWVSSDRDQKAYVFFGSNDGAKVWVNGELAHSVYSPQGRACVAGEDVFTVNLREGLNPVLVKVEDAGGRAWEFTLEVCDAEGVKAKDAVKEEATRLKQFQQAVVVPEQGRGFILPLGSLPRLVWENPEQVARLVGETPLETTWYDARMRRVTQARRPGRYAAFAEGRTASGLHVRRAMTFYVVDESWQPSIEDARVYLRRLPRPPELKQPWLAAAEKLGLAADMDSERRGTPAQAVLLAALDEVRGLDRPLGPTDAPETLDADYHLKLRHKILGTRAPGLALPRRHGAHAAPVLRPGTPEEAGMAPDTPEKLDALFTEWYEATGVPFTTLIARNGVVLNHKAYGPKGIDVETPFWIASITKAVAGVMFAQFVDQGLIGVDDPVGNYLPGFPVEGEQTLTFRHCFTHTSGYAGHMEWGGLHNPWLDNVMANGVGYLQPGRVREYNGMGLDLAGVAMANVAGKSIFRLMQENFFLPLGLAHTGVVDLGGYMYCSAEDLARIGQLMANGGAYGDRVFFTPETLEKLLPVELHTIYPGVYSEWGVGIASMREPHPRAGHDGVPEDATLLSRNVVGHGAASSSIFRVDLDNNLVIVQTRNETGADYDAYARRLYQLLDESLTR